MMMVIDFIKEKKGKKEKLVGVVAINPETMNTGWSLCSKQDTFDAVRGITIAMGRTMARTEAAKGILPAAKADLISVSMNMLRDEYKDNLQLQVEEYDHGH